MVGRGLMWAFLPSVTQLKQLTEMMKADVNSGNA
jgi:hypothetical protein